MKTLLRQNIPQDFIYYRTGSEVFHTYSKDFFWGDIVDVAKSYPQFLRIEKFFWGNWNTIDTEKIDEEPDISLLKSLGYRHGIVFWSPLRRTQKPKGWIRLPAYFARKILHASRSAFSVLDRNGEHWKKWSSKARNHRNQVLRDIGNGTIHIELSEDIDLFYTSYKEAQIRDPNKRIYTQWLEKIRATQKMKNKRIYFGYIGDSIVAGALFIDMGTTSEYFMSFYPPESREHQFGIGIIDRWMTDSSTLGFKYCDFDHMWDSGNPRKQKGYTEFKSSIAEYDVYFHDVWIKIF